MSFLLPLPSSWTAFSSVLSGFRTNGARTTPGPEDSPTTWAPKASGAVNRAVNREVPPRGGSKKEERETGRVPGGELVVFHGCLFVPGWLLVE